MMVKNSNSSSNEEEEFSSPKRPNMASSDENLASATPVPGEESNDNLPPEPSLAEIKGILNSIQETVNNILGENQKLKEELKEPWPEISDMKTARARISRPIWPRNIQRVCMTSIRQNEIEGVVAHLEHLPRSL